MKKTILIAVTSDLATDQRVQKVASFFHRSHLNVTLIGRQLAESPTVNFPFRTVRMGLFFRRSVFFYAEYNVRLFFYLLLHRSSYILSNDTDTLVACFLAAKLKNATLLFDAHELFPEVPELSNRKFVQKVWVKIEQLLFPHLTHAYTVCDSIANYYRNKYGLAMQVVRNIPRLKKTNVAVQKPIPLDVGSNQIILYQGALNKGRGIEWIIQAMPYVPNAVFVIIGSGDMETELKNSVRLAKLENKVLFLGRISASELNQYTPMANVGVCLLEDCGLSYQYALPNRIFDYLHAGVPVLATDFVEIRKIVATYQTGILIHHYEPEYLASILISMLQNPMDKSHFKQLSESLCWENEEKILAKMLLSM
ncbi:MAG: hypothetical protein AUK44_00225 [Porphyromonadaceae bacterium CG2_30_38_12]|nr:MAG: hypothetical protein AUK44_00225 [Porphyromonadaceae bacterium CG2_30_38_12]